MNNQKKFFVGIGIGLVLVLLIGVFVWPGTGGNSNNSQRNDGPPYVVAPVERRTLSDEITVRGEIRRDQLKRITANVDGKGKFGPCG
ncbi:MAG: hypothetical protein Ct9H90mP5_05440 [Acidimicrobiaceae bacterium]|nr:MAG: hypothetical protein Ct9H90mP5_05440 [Acidimicrobiaceae bacterium]